jgi:hypothetical protein
VDINKDITPDITLGPMGEYAVPRGKARSAPGSSLHQGLMPARTSSSDPLHTLASAGGAAEGARVQRACRVEGRARRPI